MQNKTWMKEWKNKQTAKHPRYYVRYDFFSNVLCRKNKCYCIGYSMLEIKNENTRININNINIKQCHSNKCFQCSSLITLPMQISKLCYFYTYTQRYNKNKQTYCRSGAHVAIYIKKIIKKSHSAIFYSFGTFISWS